MSEPQARTPSIVATSPPVLQPDPHAIAVVSDLRHRDLMTILKRLGRLTDRGWDRRWSTVSTLMFGGLLGGAFGLVPFLSARPAPSHEARLVYFIVLGLAFVLAVVCAIAAMTVRREREDSVGAIREDLEGLLKVYSHDEVGSVR